MSREHFIRLFVLMVRDLLISFVNSGECPFFKAFRAVLYLNRLRFGVFDFVNFYVNV